MKSRITDEEVSQVVTLKKGGMKHRDISEKVFGVRTRASTVHMILSKTLYKEIKVEKGPDAKILLLDLESAPAISYHFGRWKINVGPAQVIQRPYLITYACKWLGSSYMMSDMLPNFESSFQNDPTDDKELVKALWELLDSADIVVAHYGKKFDFPLLNTRFVTHGLKPPSPYKVIDTKEIASKYFKFESAALKELAQHLGCDNEKIKTDFSLWRGCMEGDMQSWNDMLVYNEMDTIVLEDVYMKLRGWASNHPAVSLFAENNPEKMCGVCGSEDLEKLAKTAKTNVSSFEVYQCNSCGHLHRTRKNLNPKEKRDNILSNIAG